MSPEREARARADLAEIQSAIARGQREDAAAKLQALSINVAPGQVLSKEIGELFDELGFDEMAGRYWYLLDDKSEEMIAACRKFEHSLGDSPLKLADEFIFMISAAAQPAVWVRVRDLRDRARAYQKAHEYPYAPRKRTVHDTVGLLCCGTVGFVLLFLIAMGIVFMTTWFH